MTSSFQPLHAAAMTNCGFFLCRASANESICFAKIPAIKPILSEETKIEASIADIAGYIAGIPMCVWYYKTKHFLANNILGVIFSIQGIELLSLGSVKVGTILLVFKKLKQE